MIQAFMTLLAEPLSTEGCNSTYLVVKIVLLYHSGEKKESLKTSVVKSLHSFKI